LAEARWAKTLLASISPSDPRTTKPNISNRFFPIEKPAPLQNGLCIVGHLQSEIGLGQAARCLAYACDARRLPVSFCNLPLLNRDNDTEFATKCNGIADRKASLYVAALHTVPDLQREIHRDRLNILYPYWELHRAPAKWLSSAGRFDEIWAPTTFVAAAFEQSFGRPVRLVRQPVRLPRVAPNPTLGSGSTLKLLVFFDFDSSGARKNPVAAVKAFQSAFAPTRRDVELIVKMRGVRDGGLRHWLARAAACDPRIHLIDRTLDRAAMDALIAKCDALVSLHRSEGFGFGPVEAIIAGKAVVATDYSGTRDFIAQTTGYPVDYDLVPVRPGEYPGAEKQEWADPRIESAAMALRSIYDHPDDARARTLAAFALLQERHAPTVVGAEISQLLTDLGAL
jgi:glycosyltransferase involved in cell wall biosynthesis